MSTFETNKGKNKLKICLSLGLHLVSMLVSVFLVIIFSIFYFLLPSQLYSREKLSTDERIELDAMCSDHIASLVDLRWHIPSSETRGRISLKGITLTPEMLDLVRMSPVQWGK